VTSATRACPRCRGTSDDLAQFCRFCGAALAPGAVVVKTPTVPDPSVASFWRPPVPAIFVEASQAAAVVVSAELPGIPPTLDGEPQGPSSALRPLAPAAANADEGRPTAAPAQLPSYGRIVVITKEGGEGASYPLRDQLDIGRSEGDVVIAEDRYLSPRHARLSRHVQAGKPPEFILVDLASTNGIYLRLGREGAREATLEDQDLFLVGQQVLKFDVVRDAEEGLAPATQHGTLLFGTPTVPRYARLSQRTVEGVTRDVFHVQKAETVLGRESGDIVFTDDPFLSRRHAAIKFDHAGRRFVLSDLGSSNGTFVQIRGQVTIKSGDQFRIGQQLFRVDLSAASAP
jgi:pSer/pThr/pTyr-binding forkhead associated (FHA) protein